MNLIELNPVFIRHEKTDSGGTCLQEVPTIDLCQGIKFLCPKCFKDNNGIVGTHKIICWSHSRGVPDGLSPGPGRWKISGTALDDVTLSGDDVPGASNSVWLRSGCKWHGFIEEGLVRDA